MLKYFKKQKLGRLNSTNGNDHHYNNNTAATRVATDKVDGSRSCDIDCGTPEEESAAASKRYSLRSTSSFCDEVFLEELANVGCAAGGGGSGSEDDAVSYGAISLGAVSGGAGAAASATYTMAVNSIVGFDEDLFKYHSRLSMTVKSIVNEPNCLSYFVQYLDKKNALPFIKFYLDTENFKNAALAQLRKEHKNKLTTLQIPEESDYEPALTETTTTLNDTDDQIQQNKQQHQSETHSSVNPERNISNVSCGNSSSVVGVVAVGIASNENEDDSSNVPELKTLCDLTMRKPLTDDEKSQIYAETNKHIIINRNNERHRLKASSELSLCSLSSNFSEINENAVISIASVKDALTIYKKYLIQESKQLIELPVDILSKISLIICKKDAEDQDGGSTSITADCFLDAQQYVLNKLEKEYLNDFLQSIYYSKYCVELIDGQHVNINDILHSEVTLFYFMEYLEQHGERDCLDFWSTAINYRKSYESSADSSDKNEKEAQADAMIIYEKFFSLQSEMRLWSSNKLRANVEACICTEGMVQYCFDLPLKVEAKYLERKYLKSFLKSSLFSNYINELKSKIKEDFDRTVGLSKLALRRCVSDKTSNRHRKTLSDCTLDKKVTISQHNTLLAAMDSQSHHHSTSTAHLKQFQLHIDSSQLTNPDLLWHRSNSNNLKFGRVNSLGRYERDFVSPSDALHTTSTSAFRSTNNWSLSLNGTKLKNAMRKLVHLPEDNVQEEIAWQVAEMIVKDVTSVTMGAKPSIDEDRDKRQKI